MGEKQYQRHLQRLQEEQKKALQETDDQIKQWLNFKSDYEALQKRLVSLPDNLSYDVMVPFGKMAFMPGHLVHTNEILVLLGDNWFAERSAKQAAEIVQRRLIAVNKNIEDLRKQRQLLEPRHQFTEELGQLSKEGSEMFEIREEYDEEKEQIWKDEHRKNVKEYRTRLKQERKQETIQAPPEEQTALTNEELWARLDQLEEIEDKRREMEKVGTIAETKLEGYRYPDFPRSDKSCNLTQYESSTHYTTSTGPDIVSDSDGEESSYTASDELDSDDDDDDQWVEDECSGETTSKGTLINFSHSKVSTEPSSSSAVSDIVSPGDIYPRFLKTVQPRSILKKSPGEQKRKVRHKTKKTAVSFDTGTDEDSEVKMDKFKLPAQAAEKAFSSTVVEKSSTELPTFTAPQQVSQQRPVSRFKARSTNQNLTEEISITDAKTNHTEVQENKKPVSKFKAKRQSVQS